MVANAAHPADRMAQTIHAYVGSGHRNGVGQRLRGSRPLLLVELPGVGDDGLQVGFGPDPAEVFLGMLRRGYEDGRVAFASWGYGHADCLAGDGADCLDDLPVGVAAAAAEVVNLVLARSGVVEGEQVCPR